MASPTLGRGGYHGCATWPTITAAAATQGSERAGVQDEGATTAHTLSGASPAHHIHARTQDRRVARVASVLRAQPLSPAPRQRRGGLHGQTERLSAHAGSTQIVGSSQQSGGVRWPPVVAGTQAEVRSGEGKGGGSPARAGRCARRGSSRFALEAIRQSLDAAPGCPAATNSADGAFGGGPVSKMGESYLRVPYGVPPAAS